MKPYSSTDATDALEVANRRRPGRREVASPELIELLRGTGGAGFIAPEEDDDSAELSAARGVKIAVSLSALFWVVALGLVVVSFR